MAEAALRVSAEVATVVELSRFAAEFVKDMHRGGLLEGGDESGRYDHVPAIPLIQQRSVLTHVVRGDDGIALRRPGAVVLWLCQCSRETQSACQPRPSPTLPLTPPPR